MMKITSLHATSHSVAAPLPLEQPVRDPLGIVAVHLESDEGVSGFALSLCGAYRRPLTMFLNTYFAEFLIGRDAWDAQAIWRALSDNWSVFGRTRFAMGGLMNFATSILDMALWDIRGKAVGQPVYRLLGGRQTVQAHATFGFLQFTRDQLASHAERLAEDGYRRLEIMAGVGNADDVIEDSERVRTVREAVGDSMQLMLDGDLRFDYPHAQRLAQLAAPYGLTWLEEPVVANDCRHLAMLRNTVGLPIAAGQFEGDLARYDELLNAEAIDFVLINPYFVGFTTAQKVAHRAEASNIPVVVAGGWPYGAQLAAGVGAWGVEVHMRYAVLTEMLFKEAPIIRKGEVVLDDRPGLGLEIDEEALDRFVE